MGRGLIDDDAHGALRGVRAHIDQAAREALVTHGGHRNQHLSVEVAALAAACRPRLAPPAGALFAWRQAGWALFAPQPARWALFAPQSRFATQFHGEMLPDCS